MSSEPLTLWCRLPDGERALQPCTLRTLLPADVPAILALQAHILAALPDPALLAPDEAAFFARLIAAPRGRVEGIFWQARLVALSILRVPEDAPDNLGRDLGLSGAALLQVAHMEMVLVDPMFRGNGLQQQFLQRRIAQAAAVGCTHLLATVDPENLPSLHNLLASGFGIARADVRKYGGKRRHILVRSAATADILP